MQDYLIALTAPSAVALIGASDDPTKLLLGLVIYETAWVFR